jgi:hypothetical protein
VARESSLGFVDQYLRSGTARVSDVDHNQVTVARFGKCLLHDGADLNVMTKLGDDVGQAA